MGYAMAGLLSGLGKGIEQFGKSIEERRAAALEAARKEASEQRATAQRQAERAEDRTWKKEDNATEQTQAIERIDRTAANATAAQKAGFDHSSSEATKDRQFKAASEKRQMGHEGNMARLRAKLDSAKSRDEINLRASIESGQVLDSYTTEDGKLAIIYKGGRREITDDPGSRQSAATGPVLDANGLPVSPSAAPPAAKAPAPVDNSKAQATAMAALSTAYNAARKDPKGMRNRYPALFNADGSLKSMEEAKNMVRSRYAN